MQDCVLFEKVIQSKSYLMVPRRGYKRSLGHRTSISYHIASRWPEKACEAQCMLHASINDVLEAIEETHYSQFMSVKVKINLVSRPRDRI